MLPTSGDDGEFDVIVVGGGGSGLAAAVSAAEQGAHVALLEKRPTLGGTTGIAVGSFTAAGTALQQAQGIADTPAAHAEDAARFASPAIESQNNEPLRRYFLGEAAETLRWLQGLGLSFFGPSPEPPNRVARMHNVVPGAKAYIAALQFKLQQLQAPIFTSAAVCQLLQQAGRVTGVEVEMRGKRSQIHARRAVILAAGDYAASAELIARFKGPQFAAIEGINPYADGDGHLLAEQAGAKLLNMQITYGPELRFVAPVKKAFQWLPAGGRSGRILGTIARCLPGWVIRAYIKRLLVTWQHPENALFDDGAILVNQAGERFTDERRSPDRELAVAEQPGKQAYILLDGALQERYSAWPHFISTAPNIAYAYVKDYLRLRPDVTVTAQTLEGVAKQRGLNAVALQATVAASQDSTDPSRGPWTLLGPVKAYFTTTEGGAAVNERLEVLDGEGNPISGLFAVGQNGLGGQILWGHGLHIAWAMTSGRLAGIHAAQTRPHDP